MQLKEWLSNATKELTDSGIGSARLDCIILMEDELGRDRSWILAHLEEKIPTANIQNLNKKLTRRVSHEPLSYIRGFSEFYGRKFLIDKRVLEPRPESEAMIELIKQLELPSSPIIVDVGTGSGALAITVKLELPASQVIAIDIDPSCLKVARVNARALGDTRIELLQGDLVVPLEARYWRDGTILANLPYVPNNFRVNRAAAMEPRLAISGGSDGLDVYRRLFEQLKELPWSPKFILTESLPPQHEVLAQIAKDAGFDLYKSQDFIQVFRSSRS